MGVYTCLPRVSQESWQVERAASGESYARARVHIPREERACALTDTHARVSGDIRRSSLHMSHIRAGGRKKGKGKLERPHALFIKYRLCLTEAGLCSSQSLFFFSIMPVLSIFTFSLSFGALPRLSGYFKIFFFFFFCRVDAVRCVPGRPLTRSLGGGTRPSRDPSGVFP